MAVHASGPTSYDARSSEGWRVGSAVNGETSLLRKGRSLSTVGEAPGSWALCQCEG
jgi:hypothetical protein